VSGIEALYSRWGVTELPDGKVRMSEQVFQSLLFLALGRLRYSEEDYLARHSDVKEAIERGTFASGWQHFVWAGVAENRELMDVVVNAGEYVQMNPDLLEIYSDNDDQGLAAHWKNVGWLEGRPRGPS
jgi:hypothetical protein